jgi:sugar O-acyltransferase (sialic acid O-acetyltransferase NeuD family)
MKKPLLIYGAGGLGREILSLVRSAEEFEPAGFIDDSIAPGNRVNGLKVAGGFDTLMMVREPVNLIIALGDPAAKSEIIKKITNPYVDYPVVLHPSVIIQDIGSVLLGKGCIVTAGCILTTNIRIGTHVLVNLNVTIGHDVSIGHYSSIMPGVNIAGEVIVGEGVLIGSGANILNRMTLGDRSKVGMGAVVIRDVDVAQTVAGVPAKPVR